MDKSLIQLGKVVQMLAEAKTLGDIKKIIDIAEAARTYAQAAKMGTEAANHAAEIKIRAQRKAGELLAQLERSKGGERTHSDQAGTSVSDYRAVLEAEAIAPTTAHRWQQVAKIEPEIFEQKIAVTLESGGELTTQGILRGGIHVAQNSGENEWYTPTEYLEAARLVIGEFDLDPASSVLANARVNAKTFYTKEDDGLSKDWSGVVWMNPPYAGNLIKQFAAKFAGHVLAREITAGIVLVNNATETDWFYTLVSCAAAIVFTSHRVKFLDMSGNPGAPLQGQAFIYFGRAPKKFIKEFSKFGWGAVL